MPRSAVHGRMASGDAREGQKSCADTSVIEETDIMRIQTLQMDVERCKKLFHFSRTSIAASLRQMNRGVMSDLSKLAGALTIVNERTLAREETADGTIKLLREKSEIFEEEAVALKDENEKLRRSSAMKQSGNDHAVALSLSYQRHVPRLRAAATRCASHTQGVRDAIKAVLEEYGEALSADTTKLRKAVVSVQRNAKRESDDASKLRREVMANNERLQGDAAANQAKINALEERLLVLTERNDELTRQANAARTEVERMREENLSRKGHNDQLVARNLAYRRSAPRMQAAAVRCASQHSAARGIISASLDEFAASLARDTASMAAAIANVNLHATSQEERFHRVIDGLKTDLAAQQRDHEEQKLQVVRLAEDVEQKAALHKQIFTALEVERKRTKELSQRLEGSELAADREMSLALEVAELKSKVEEAAKKEKALEIELNEAKLRCVQQQAAASRAASEAASRERALEAQISNEQKQAAASHETAAARDAELGRLGRELKEGKFALEREQKERTREREALEIKLADLRRESQEARARERKLQNERGQNWKQELQEAKHCAAHLEYSLEQTRQEARAQREAMETKLREMEQFLGSEVTASRRAGEAKARAEMHKTERERWVAREREVRQAAHVELRDAVQRHEEEADSLRRKLAEATIEAQARLTAAERTADNERRELMTRLEHAENQKARMSEEAQEAQEENRRLRATVEETAREDAALKEAEQAMVSVMEDSVRRLSARLAASEADANALRATVQRECNERLLLQATVNSLRSQLGLPPATATSLPANSPTHLTPPLHHCHVSRSGANSATPYEWQDENRHSEATRATDRSPSCPPILGARKPCNDLIPSRSEDSGWGLPPARKAAQAQRYEERLSQSQRARLPHPSRRPRR